MFARDPDMKLIRRFLLQFATDFYKTTQSGLWLVGTCWHVHQSVKILHSSAQVDHRPYNEGVDTESNAGWHKRGEK